VNRAQLLLRTLGSAAVLGAALYAGDFAVLRVRSMRATPNWPLESTTRTRVLAIPMKNGKYDYQIDAQQPVETVTCVHALFPHGGSNPCWYVKPRLNQPIPVN